MNYGEELAYWYLRLNGFFPITNFVIHRSDIAQHTSDIDVLAVRPPHVFEEIGGQPKDWDEYLTANLNFSRLIGLVCEVKTGAFDEARIFRPEQLKYSLPRLGLFVSNEMNPVLEKLVDSQAVELEAGAIVAKLFISTAEHSNGSYLNRTLSQIEDFLAERVRCYPIEKYADRMFFPSSTFQLIIGQVHRSIAQRRNE